MILKAVALLIVVMAAGVAQAAPARECKQIGRSTVCTNDRGEVETCKQIGRSRVCDKELDDDMARRLPGGGKMR
jgi:hypothetical protein